MTEPSTGPSSEPAELALAAEFEPPTHEQWQRLVAGVLRKSGAIGEDTPEHPERLLAGTTYDGITLQPLYTAADAAQVPDAGVPGLPPYVRGSRPEGRIATGWDNRPRHATADPAATNAAVLADLDNGAGSIWLRVGDGGVPPESLADALNGVYLDLAPVVLDPGADYVAAAEAFLALAAEREIPPGELTGTLGADPIGLRARTGEPHDLRPAAELAARVAGEYPKLRSTVVDALPYHDAGGSDAQELAASLAAGVAYLRAYTAAGMTVAQAAGQLEFRYAATADQFLTIAKLRAARRLWARVCEASGAAEAGAGPGGVRGGWVVGGMSQHAVTSSAMLSRRDPWVNLLRGTVACFAAAIGGADAVTVQPFDAAIGLPDAFSRRIARNTGSILAEESRLAGVIDPAGGSWYVERLTDELARAAWREFQELEALGGIEQALDTGALAERLEATWQARAAKLATREDQLTGVSEFPHLDQQPVEREPLPDGALRRQAAPAGLPVHRYAEEFERLRDRSDAHLKAGGVRPRVFLATLGPVAKHTARASFAANLFAAGGIEPVNPGATATTADVLAAFMHAKTTVACLCGIDLAYAEQADEVAAALKQAGATQVLLAGKPSDAYAGVGGFVYQGCNAIEVLTSTLEQLEVTQ